jgi:hypothetical protein
MIPLRVTAYSQEGAGSDYGLGHSYSYVEKLKCGSKFGVIDYLVDASTLAAQPGVNYSFVSQPFNGVFNLPVGTTEGAFADGSWLLNVSSPFAEGDHSLYVAESYQCSAKLSDLYSYNYTAVKDEDKDGVIDTIDKCSGTPTGSTVDENGCREVDVDTDGDNLCNTGVNFATSWCTGVDKCPEVAGSVEFSGCPAGVEGVVTLQLVDQARTKDLCGKLTDTFQASATGSECKKNAVAEVKVYNLNKLSTISDPETGTTYGTNPKADLLDNIFENPAAEVAVLNKCSGANCNVGLTNAGTVLIIAKTPPPTELTGVANLKTAYVGKKASTADFVNNRLSPNLKVIMTRDKNGLLKYNAAGLVTVTGSKLEIMYPLSTEWTDLVEYYPFVFSSDSDWTVDVCMQLPEGYKVVDPDTCTQVVVVGQTTMVMFTLQETSSPEPNMGATFKVKHNGKVKSMKVEIPGKRVKNLKQPKKI